MTDYLCALSEDNYEILYEIIRLKYRKFIRIYWLLKDYSDNISMLKYKEKTDKDKLKITVTFSNIDTNQVASKLRSCVDNDSDEIYIDVHKNDIDIDIYKSEFDI